MWFVFSVFLCYLIQDKLVTLETLNKVKKERTIDTNDVVKKIIPKYVSKTVKTNAQKYVKENFKLDVIIKS